MGDVDTSVGATDDDIHDRLVRWYEDHHRSFPWRESDDPWEILVVEVMSQQTQLDRITDPWAAFVERWPTPADLATSNRSEVVSFWSEHRLGYNRRAVHLHEAATRIVEEFDGTVPSLPAELETLPGVGPYTANAVASFAFGTGEAVVDTNVKRILYRAFEVPDDRDAFERVANDLADHDAIGAWNAAIMELGGVACRKTPRCDEAECPLRDQCSAYRTGDFTAPDVPTQPDFEGSRRQFRGRVLQTLRASGPLAVDELGRKIRVDYEPDGDAGRAWLEGILEDMDDDGLIEQVESDPLTVRLAGADAS